MKIQIYTKFTGIDKNGNIIAERKWEEANSLVQAFPAILYTMMSQSPTPTSVPDTSNVNRGIATNTANFKITLGTAGVTNVGIVAGTGTNAVAITDYALQTLIAHGTGSGELQYSTYNFPTGWTVGGGNAYFTTDRTLTNSSGGNITINEVGFVTNGGSISTYYFLIDRTLPTPYTVNNGTGVIITYKWQVSV